MVTVIEETLYLVKPAGNPDFHRLSISVNIILSFKECFSLIVLKGPKRLSLKGNENCTKEQKGCQGERCEFRCFVCHYGILAIKCRRWKCKSSTFLNKLCLQGKSGCLHQRGAYFVISFVPKSDFLGQLFSCKISFIFVQRFEHLKGTYW